jgi:hypothetical protein
MSDLQFQAMTNLTCYDDEPAYSRRKSKKLQVSYRETSDNSDSEGSFYNVKHGSFLKSAAAVVGGKCFDEHAVAAISDSERRSAGSSKQRKQTKTKNHGLATRVSGIIGEQSQADSMSTITSSIDPVALRRAIQNKNTKYESRAPPKRKVKNRIKRPLNVRTMFLPRPFIHPFVHSRKVLIPD